MSAILGSIVVSISACHAEDPGSIPGRGGFFNFNFHFALFLFHPPVSCLFLLLWLIFFLQADCILLVGLAEKGPTGGKVKQRKFSHSSPTSPPPLQIVQQVETISVRVQKELVLLHRQGVDHPTGTVKWLNALGWLSSYFHVMGI